MDSVCLKRKREGLLHKPSKRLKRSSSVDSYLQLKMIGKVEKNITSKFKANKIKSNIINIANLTVELFVNGEERNNEFISLFNDKVLNIENLQEAISFQKELLLNTIKNLKIWVEQLNNNERHLQLESILKRAANRKNTTNKNDSLLENNKPKKNVKDTFKGKSPLSLKKVDDSENTNDSISPTYNLLEKCPLKEANKNNSTDLLSKRLNTEDNTTENETFEHNSVYSAETEILEDFQINYFTNKHPAESSILDSEILRESTGLFDSANTKNVLSDTASDNSFSFNLEDFNKSLPIADENGSENNPKDSSIIEEANQLNNEDDPNSSCNSIDTQITEILTASQTNGQLEFLKNFNLLKTAKDLQQCEPEIQNEDINLENGFLKEDERANKKDEAGVTKEIDADLVDNAIASPEVLDSMSESETITKLLAAFDEDSDIFDTDTDNESNFLSDEDEDKFENLSRVTSKVVPNVSLLYETDDEQSNNPDRYNQILQIMHKEISDEELLRTYNIQPCSIRLEKSNKLDILADKFPYDDFREIERLTDLSTLEKNRNTNNKNRKVKKKKLKSAGSKSNESDTDISDTNDVIASPSISNQSILSMSDITDDEFIDALLNSPKFDSSDEFDNDEQPTNKEKSNKSTVKNDSDNVKIKLENEKEGHAKEKASEKSKWRNDPLLRGKLSSSESEDDENVQEGSLFSRQLKDKFTTCIKDENKENINNDNDKKGKEKLRRESTLTDKSLLKNHIVIDSDTEDSDIEFISEIKKQSGSKFDSDDPDVNDSESSPDKKKGRRNIRAILSDETLEEATKQANLREKERKERLTQKQKEMDSILSSSFEISQDEVIILDINEDTKEPCVKIDPVLSKRLKPHQKDGVRFMWECCYESVERLKEDDGSGCILAHCMGLGKTFQVVTLIHTLFKHKDTNTKHVLIVCPLSIVLNWVNEFKTGLKHLQGDIKINYFRERSASGKEKLQIINLWRQQEGVLIMGYEAYQRITKFKDPNNLTPLEVNIKKNLVDPGPDLVVLDEGHLLKNGKNCRTKALMKVKTKRRIVLTGTPLQNNLTEYYYMVNFVKPNLLGSFLEYTNRFINPITNGQYDDSTIQDIIQMKKRSHILHKMLKGTVQRYEVSELRSYLPEKYDYVLHIQLHPLQIKLYEKYMELLKAESDFKRKLFSNYHNLQMIWTHPYILHLRNLKKKQRKKEPQEMDVIILDKEIPEVDELPEDWWYSLCPEDFQLNIEYGPKFKVMVSIIKECERIGDKLLIFSSSLMELDVIEFFFKQQLNWCPKQHYYRMDGGVLPEARLEMCNSFNDPQNKQMRAMIISHKVGGLGLNLVEANRVILMDISWNPAYDIQSIFRMYRFGQEKKCYVYRLVSMGTMEEVVYERQVTKLAIAMRVVDEMQISRHYKSIDLQKMYRTNFILNVDRPHFRVPQDHVLATVLLDNKCIFKYHEHQSLLENLPEEELNEEEMKLAWDEFNRENEESARKKMIPVQFNPNEITNYISGLAEITPQPGFSGANNDVLIGQNMNLGNFIYKSRENAVNSNLQPNSTVTAPLTTQVASNTSEIQSRFLPETSQQNVHNASSLKYRNKKTIQCPNVPQPTSLIQAIPSTSSSNLQKMSDFCFKWDKRYSSPLSTKKIHKLQDRPQNYSNDVVVTNERDPKSSTTQLQIIHDVDAENTTNSGHALDRYNGNKFKEHENILSSLKANPSINITLINDEKARENFSVLNDEVIEIND